MISLLTAAFGLIRTNLGPSLVLCVVGGVLGAGTGWLVRSGQIADLRVQLAEERAAVSADRFKALQDLHTQAEAGWRGILDSLDVASRALSQRAREIAREEASLKTLQEKISHETDYACRRRPLPHDLIEQLRRPAPLPATAPDRDTSVHPAP